MPDLHSSPRCSGTRMLRWAAVVVPAAVVMTGAFGTTGAYAAAGGNSAVHTAADANHGVGNMVGNGNDKHADTTTTTPTTTTDTSTSSVATTTDSSTATGSTPTASTDATSHQVDCTATPTDPRCAPQPLSGADQNTGGANGQCPSGPYCSTRDGSASGNGNGNGQAVGKPCAGCVGKADNKNPKGQNPNGSDHNAGYECDRNHGIGRTNPAHTGCKPKPPVCTAPNTLVNGVCTPPSSDCTTNPTAAGCTHNSDCTTNPTAPGCTHNGGGDCTTNPTAAGCQSENGGDCTTNPNASGCDNSGGGTTCVPTAANNFCSSVLGEKVTHKPTVQGEKVVKTPNTLPFTGANTALLLIAGGTGLVAGATLMVAGRRRRELA